MTGLVTFTKSPFTKGTLSSWHVAEFITYSFDLYSTGAGLISPILLVRRLRHTELI